jgi:hypothetical protein
VFNIHERPTGQQLEAFRLRCVYRGRVPTQQEFADSIGMPVSTYRGYCIETKGTLMQAQAWTLLRITWDALLLAQWQQQHRPHTRDNDEEEETATRATSHGATAY